MEAARQLECLQHFVSSLVITFAGREQSEQLAFSFHLSFSARLAHIVSPRGDLLRIRLQPRPMRQRVDAERCVPDQESRNRASPYQPSDTVSPSIPGNHAWQNEPREQGDRHVISMLKPHDDVRLEVAPLDELHSGIGGFPEDPAAVRVPQAVCCGIWVVDWGVGEAAVRLTKHSIRQEEKKQIGRLTGDVDGAAAPTT